MLKKYSDHFSFPSLYSLNKWQMAVTEWKSDDFWIRSYHCLEYSGVSIVDGPIDCPPHYNRHGFYALLRREAK
jgi:hypothetical protein